jgi:hypothetical protein
MNRQRSYLWPDNPKRLGLFLLINKYIRMAYNKDINFTKGDTIRWSQFFRNSDGSTFLFNGCTLYMSVRESYSSGATVVSYSQYIDETVPPPAGLVGGLGSELSGTMYICIGASYSNALKPERTGAYEIKVVSAQKNTTSILKGNLYTEQNVTTLQTGGITGATGSTADSYNLYVSNIFGNDLWSGELSYVEGTSGPVASLTKAVQYANGYTGNKDIEIRVLGGTYRILGTQSNQCFYLDENNFTNSENRTITLKKAFSNQDVIFRGDETLSYSDFSLITNSDPMWSKLSSNPSARSYVYVADVSSFDLGKIPQHYVGYRWGLLGANESWGALPSIPELVYNGYVMKPSRWPNASGITYSGYSFNETAQIGDQVEDIVREGTIGWRFQNPDVSGINGIFKYPSTYDSIIADWDVNDDITMMHFARYDWAEEYYKVLAIDKINREITIRSKNSRHSVTNNAFCDGGLTYADPALRRWYVTNVPYNISSGEYYIDRNTNKLYFYPPTPLSEYSEISLTHRALAGCASYVGANDTVYAQRGYNDQTNAPATGLTYTFDYPGWTGMNPNTGYTASGGDIQSRHIHNTKNGILSMIKLFKVRNLTIDGLTLKNCAGSAIQLDLCDNITIKNCNISNTKYHGVNNLGGTNIVVDNCTFTDVGLSGVICTGGNYQTLQSSGNIVQNCTFERCAGNNPSQSFGILCCGVGNTLSQNLFKRFAGQAIFIGGINNTIEYNHFYDTNRDTEDTGTVYAFGDYLSFNNKIRYNFFNQNGSALPGATAYYSALRQGEVSGCTSNQHQITAGIYIDGFMSGFEIYKNVFYMQKDYGQCIFLNGGVRNSVYNNIFINSDADSVRFNKYYGSTILSTLIQDDEYALLNPNDYPYYPTGGTAGSGDPRIIGYNWWNYYASNYGRDRFASGIPTLILTTDIRSSPYTTAAPWLTGDLTITGDDVTGFSNFNSYKSILVPVYNNVLINNSSILVPIVGATGAGLYEEWVGGLSAYNTATFASVETFNGFVDPNNLNFKLTDYGLQSIQSKISGFQDIPFEQIPTL